MSDGNPTIDPAVAEQLARQLGLDGFIQQMVQLQESLGKVAQGMGALGESAQRQSQDTENLAAHILAIESVLTVIMRQIPVDIAEVRAEATRRTENMAGAGDGKSVVVQLAEDIVKRAED